MASQPVKIEYYRDASRPSEFRWRMKRSGRIIADSGESYKKAASMKRTVNNLLEALGDGNFEEIDNITATKPAPKSKRCG